MISEADFGLKNILSSCPFFHSCPLPKIRFLCKIPDCRNCTDYISNLEKFNKLNSKTLRSFCRVI